MPPPVRYTRSGEINLAYQVIGSGPVDIALCMGSYSHLDVLWESAQFTRLFERVGEFARLLLFDRRGVGLSDRLAEPQTLEQRNDDIRAVLDAAGSERAFILGLSEGGNMATLFAATYPDRTIGLILHGTKPRWAWAPDWPYGTTQESSSRHGGPPPSAITRTTSPQNGGAAGWDRRCTTTPPSGSGGSGCGDRWPRRQRATSNRS